MVNVVVAGVFGKMGQEIVRTILDEPSMSIKGVFEHPDHPKIGEEVAGIEVVAASALQDILQGADVLIDFTHHTATMENARIAAEAGKRMVIGTTGFTPEEASEIRNLGRKTALVWAPNMSVGINLMFRLVREMARILGPSYDVEILEAHHRMKKDAPSGTALRLGELIAETHGTHLEEVGVFARHGITGTRNQREIGLQTIRAGDIVGEHTVMFAGPGERLELIHRCHSRANFARGAVQAALWVAGRPAGLYDMQDVLGLE